MSRDADGSSPSTMAPDDAFSMLGNETRIGILQTLGEAEEPLSFTELRDRVGIRQGAQFNYHLDKLVGHFVGKTEEGYLLRQPGRRVVQAILSGAVTADPTLEPTEIDFSCRHCGAPAEVGYSHKEVRLSCTECGGNYEKSAVREWDDDWEYGNLANMPLPPAAIRDRSAAGVLRAAATRSHLDALAAAGDVCPRCSATVESTVCVCENHDTTGGLCDQCDHRLAVLIDFRCTNCLYEQEFTAVMALLDVPELAAFVGERGYNTTSDGIEWGWDYDEEILSTDPFEGRFTFSIDGDSITLTVDDDLDVLDVVQ
ncbi:MAG: helix-turn-helix domain-containing protein [Halovenus sp.]